MVQKFTTEVVSSVSLQELKPDQVIAIGELLCGRDTFVSLHARWILTVKV